MTLENKPKRTKGSILVSLLIYVTLIFLGEILSYTGIVWLFMFILGSIHWINYDWGLLNYFACGFVFALLNSISHIISEYLYFIKLRKLMQRHEDLTKNTK